MRKLAAAVLATAAFVVVLAVPASATRGLDTNHVHSTTVDSHPDWD